MVEKMLQDWGFPEFVPVFQEHEIDEEALLQITDDKILQEIIPKIGQRVKFISKLKNYQDIMKSEIVFEQSNLSDLQDDFDHGSPPSVASSSQSSDVDHNANEITEAFRNATKRKMAFSGEAVFKKACRNSYNLDLRLFLQESIPGKHILNIYEHEKILNRKSRNQLSSLLISGLLSQEGALLKPIDFQILSEKICDIFPTESGSTYYIPRVPGNKKIKPVNAKGKLIDKYRNLRRQYNLIKFNDSLDEDDSNSQTDINIDSDLENNKLWLRSFQEPWEVVLEKWKSTFPLRKNDKSVTVEQFIIDWPILKHREAYSLIDSDFKQLYPDCNVSLLHEYGLWEKFFTKLKKIRKIDPTTEEFLSLLSSDINQDSKNAIQIAALPMLFPPTGRIRCQKVHWKPSIIECQESLINLVSTAGNIQELITKRRNKLHEFKLRIQPYIIVVGTSFSDITDSYLIVDNNIFPTYSVIHALDFTFKIFHALNANYPNESEHIWLIIEHLVYKIKSSEIRIPAVLTLIKDLEQC